MMAIVDIIMPTWNRGHIIQRSIDSVYRQTFKDWKLIIVDDGSRDNTRKVVDDYKKSILRNTSFFDQIIYIKFDRHMGVSFARNAGIYYSDSDYISFLDSDNWWEPRFLESNIAFLRDNVADMVYCKQKLYHLNVDDSKIVNKSFRDSFIPKDVKDINRIDLNQIVIARHVLTKVECFDESIQRLVDWDFLLRIYGHGFKVVHNDEHLSNYMMNYRDSITHTQPGGSNAGRIMRKMKHHPWNLNKENT